MHSGTPIESCFLPKDCPWIQCPRSLAPRSQQCNTEPAMLPPTHTSNVLEQDQPRRPSAPRSQPPRTPRHDSTACISPKKPYSPNNASARHGTRSSGARPVFSGSCSLGADVWDMNDTCFVLEWNSSSHLARAKRHEFLITEDPPNLDGDQHTVFPETYNNPKSSWKSTFVTQPAGCSVGLDRCFERRECVRRMAKARDGMDSGPARGSTRVAREHYDRS